MKLQILLPLVILPMLANAEDPYRLDPLAVNLDGGFKHSNSYTSLWHKSVCSYCENHR